MPRSDSPQGPLPEPIPASYYAHVGGAPPARSPLAPAVATIHRGWELRRHLPLLGSDDQARVLGGWALIGGLLTVGVLLVLAVHGVSTPSRGVASRTSPPAAASPSSTPPSADSPVPVVQTPAETPSPTPSPTPTPTPRSSPSPTRVTIALLNGPLSARRRQSVTLQARTVPGTTCAIVIGYSGAPDLGPDTADTEGNVGWSWRVNPVAPVGTWPVTVTCGGVSASTQIVVS